MYLNYNMKTYSLRYIKIKIKKSFFMYSFTIFIDFYGNTLCWCVLIIRIDLAVLVYLYYTKCWQSKRLLCDINPLNTMDDLKLIDSKLFIGYLANKNNVMVDAQATQLTLVEVIAKKNKAEYGVACAYQKISLEDCLTLDGESFKDHYHIRSHPNRTTLNKSVV